ncbi:helix-turn-helix domain-containing protein [Azotobacter chroococcum]|uniref:helix-turn-helix domain-containing protein n=1 Tax=Azotobacter chroococcum TaxID=353 RepID=UPI0010AE4D86|nr:helix-turn-helix transcriptional regulator [Azotobacter chroococcum]TKD35303.1 helix-turn-helix transcriptional regulator [Azotobacter chroococcum]
MNPILIDNCASLGFAHRLKACLYGSGYTRQDVSIGTGIPEPVLADYANGSTQPILTDIEKIARFIQVNPAWLAFRIGEKKLPSEAELITPYLEEANLSAEQLEEKYCQAGKNEHPLFKKTTWAFSIGEDDTVLEYWAWVAFRLGRALGKRSPH